MIQITAKLIRESLKPEPIYFQWQNEVLLKTIYPMRKTKLCDFLTFYKEIDLWNEYKTKLAVAVQLENENYQVTQTEIIEVTVAEYSALLPRFV